jgi:hypothetical protein
MALSHWSSLLPINTCLISSASEFYIFNSLGIVPELLEW